MEEEHTYELPNLKEAVASRDGNSQYEIPSNFTPVSVSAYATPHQDKSKLKKPVCSWLCMCALVGFILVGSAAFTSLALTVWDISQVNHQSSVIVQLQRSLSGLGPSGWTRVAFLNISDPNSQGCGPVQQPSMVL